VESITAFAEIANSYDSSRGATFSTYLYEEIRLILRNYEQRAHDFPETVYREIGLYKKLFCTDDAPKQNQDFRLDHNTFSAEEAAIYINCFLKKEFEAKCKNAPDKALKEPS
jgi:hypothetical protein